ncbi:MAG: arsenite methyltransferase [Bacillota bacterium]
MKPDFSRIVQERYDQIARALLANARPGCCSTDSCCGGGNYMAEAIDVPEELLNASLGCGNPIAIADLKEGEIVLDLGSGAGLDAFVSARLVGPHGKVYGVDASVAMVELAKQYQSKSGLSNIEFLKAKMEEIPLSDCHVDVIISNCVINLAVDKVKVMREAFRVLKPGGRIALFDTAWLQPVPEWVRQDAELWASCIGGALDLEEYRKLLKDAGFVSVEVEPVQTIELPGSMQELRPVGELASVIVKAVKPKAQGSSGL